MEINNDAYGGFLISKNVLNGVPIRYTYREKSHIQQFNGWYLYSAIDDDAYVNNPDNFHAVSATTISQIANGWMLLAIFDAPYGTDLCWLYNEQGDVVGFYDLKADRETSMEEILKTI